MSYFKKPKMILFDVGGTLFNDGKCIPADGFAKLILSAENPEVTNPQALADLWNEYMNAVSPMKSPSGETLEIPLPCVIRYACMKSGLRCNAPMAKLEEIFDRYNSSREVINGVPELLSVIKSLGIRSAVISNNMMTGEALRASLKRWIPCADFEFVLTSADLLFTKPSKNIFIAAANRANLAPEDCWYCGDGKIPDVDGSLNCGMTPVLLDAKSAVESEMRTDAVKEYLTVNNWNALARHLENL